MFLTDSFDEFGEIFQIHRAEGLEQYESAKVFIHKFVFLDIFFLGCKIST